MLDIRTPVGYHLSTMKKKSKSIHFRANALDQKRLAALMKRFETDYAGAIREALRIACEKKED